MSEGWLAVGRAASQTAPNQANKRKGFPHRRASPGHLIRQPGISVMGVFHALKLAHYSCGGGRENDRKIGLKGQIPATGSCSRT